MSCLGNCCNLVHSDTHFGKQFLEILNTRLPFLLLTSPFTVMKYALQERGMNNGKFNSIK